MQGDYHLVLRGNKWIYSQKGLTPFFFYYIICKDLQQIVKWLLQPTNMGRTICSLKNPKWLLKATTARVLSPHSSMRRPIMVGGQWWVSSLVSSPTLLLVTSSSASSDDWSTFYRHKHCILCTAVLFCRTTFWNLLMTLLSPFNLLKVNLPSNVKTISTSSMLLKKQA